MFLFISVSFYLIYTVPNSQKIQSITSYRQPGEYCKEEGWPT